jgi:hypothetical protein
MATEISRTFDAHSGAIVVRLQDSLGRVSVHTHYVLQPDGTVNDVTKAMQDAHAQTDDAAQKIEAALKANGWNGNQTSQS